MMNKKFFILTFLLLFVMTGRSQEYLNAFLTASETKAEQQRIVRNDNVATLPFFDDFTEMGNSPSQQRWQGGCVFTNSGFPCLPVNYRAATFDVVDEFGAVYKNGSSNPFIADSLMSVAIRLDSLNGNALSPSDSVYLSFYYQAGGYGDAPENNDSLVLYFGYGYDEYVVDSVNNVTYIYEKTEWKHAWSIPGEAFDSTFKKVMLPITDTCFFSNRFYLLFYNYGTLPTDMYPNERSNMDIWNIDFVYLDANRSKLSNKDPYPKVSLSGAEPRFLKRYSSMPYKHYNETSPEVTMASTYKVFMSNLDTVTHEVRYNCTVEDNNTGGLYQVDTRKLGLLEYSIAGIDAIDVSLDDFRFPDNPQADSASFTIRQYIEVVDQYGDVVAGDSIVSKQCFYNFYAYDDGTPENGYGLVPDDTYFATQFNVSSPEKIFGVQMLFNQTFKNANYNFFDIYIWGNSNGKPGEVIYVLENQRPEWPDNIYEFAYYKFEKPVQVSGTFYVGIRQHDKKTINIGFDTSFDNSKYNFYKVDEKWENSSFKGSLMIRPMVGKEYVFGVDENQSVTDEIVVYPNPVRDVLYLDGVESDECIEVTIFDVTGRNVKSFSHSNDLNVRDLNSGLYVVRVLKTDGSMSMSRFVVSK